MKAHISLQAVIDAASYDLKPGQRRPTLAQLAEFINAELGDVYSARMENWWGSFDRDVPGTRLRREGKQRKCKMLAVYAKPKPGQSFPRVVLQHNPLEPGRNNGEIARWILAELKKAGKLPTETIGVDAWIAQLRERLTVPEVERAIKLPVAKWSGNCYAIASLVLKAGLVPGGRARYGHYLGRVKRGTLFAGREVVRHGWIELPGPDKMQTIIVIDPTRWVFEGSAPYIYIGRKTDEYDAGGQKLRQEMEDTRPFPRAAGEYLLRNPSQAEADALARVIGKPVEGLTNEQCFWLANLSLPRLGEDARVLYAALKRAGHIASIPIDNLRLVEEQGGEI